MQKYLQKCWLCTMKSSTELKPIVPTMREIKVFLKKCFCNDITKEPSKRNVISVLVRIPRLFTFIKKKYQNMKPNCFLGEGKIMQKYKILCCNEEIGEEIQICLYLYACVCLFVCVKQTLLIPLQKANPCVGNQKVMRFPFVHKNASI